MRNTILGATLFASSLAASCGHKAILPSVDADKSAETQREKDAKMLEEQTAKRERERNARVDRSINSREAREIVEIVDAMRTTLTYSDKTIDTCVKEQRAADVGEKPNDPNGYRLTAWQKAWGTYVDEKAPECRNENVFPTKLDQNHCKIRELDSTRYGDDLKKYAQLLHSPAAKYVLPILDCAQKKWETRIDDPDIVTSIKDVASTIKSMEVRQIGSTYSKVACKEEDPAMCSEITCKAMTGTGGITSHGIPFDVPYNYDLTWRNVPVNGYLTEPEKKVLGCDAHSLSDRFCYKMTPKDCAEAIVKSGTADRFIAGIKNMKPFIVKQDGTIVPK